MQNGSNVSVFSSNRDILFQKLITLKVQPLPVTPSPKDVTNVNMIDHPLNCKSIIFSEQGKLEKMEDTYCFKENITIGDSILSIYCVFDGHNGNMTSDYLRDNFIQRFCDIYKVSGDIKSSLIETFTQIDSEVINICKETNDESGSTAICVIYEKSKNLIHIANCGDCRCIVFNNNANETTTSALSPSLIHNSSSSSPLNVKSITSDHRVEYLTEEERDIIYRKGGIIDYNCIGRINSFPDISVTRSIGDVSYKEPTDLLISQPDIYEYIPELNGFMFFATDGIFDGMKNEEIAQFIINNYHPHLEGEEEEEEEKEEKENIISKLFYIAKRNYDADDNLTGILLSFRNCKEK